ncbi:hypothetical protein O6H91_09G072500 [Diphasiastrum complanatum]|uniref:Uncharacterized protein n=1 Tax=Diphasiastrum complanatum TaxID=34168 RepID=A0ACC2CQP7_DIPCM|nr:hypothetical protein O6H91_09G072500 [Diphasiastrum complanatum]
MYAKCGSTEEAFSAFNNMPTPDVVCWNAMIMGFVKCGFSQRALELYQQMHSRQVNPDRVTYLAVLNACASIGALKDGRRINLEIVENGYECDDFVTSCLVDMYAKCGSIEEAFRLFQKMKTHGVVCWTSMIVGYVKCGNATKALELYKNMQLKRIKADNVTFVAVLDACASVGAVEEGRCAHAEIIQCGYESDHIVGTALVDMYAKCGSIEDACRAFSNMESRGVVCWTALIVGYVKSGNGEKALELYRLMQMEQVESNTVTFVGLLNACASLAALEEGRDIHKQIIERGYESDDFVMSALIDMYAKCGSIAEACIVFENHHTRSVVCWTSMIMGYVKCGCGEKALQVYRQMEFEQVKPDTLTFVGVLNACASIEVLEEGKRIHRAIIQSGCQSDDFVGSALVDMYAKCRSIEDASNVFDSMHNRSTVCWNTMIAGFVKCGLGQKALESYGKMQLELVQPDSVTFMAVLNACAHVAALVEGRRIHSEILKIGLASDHFVCSSLVDMYAKCGSIDEAHRVFSSMHFPTLACWTAMIGAYAMHGQGEEAIRLFERMTQECGEVNDITFVCLLSACSHASLVDEGQYYYESMDSVYGIARIVEHCACMVDLLGRSGLLDEAEGMIYRMPSGHSVTPWSALLSACRIHGNPEMGERVAEKVIELDPESASAYVLLSNIYAAAGLMGLSGQLKQAGHVPNEHFVLHDDKESYLYFHSETLAIMLGLVSRSQDPPVHIVRCVNCHIAAKFISRVERHVIVVQDGNGFYHVKGGICSGGDYW